MAGGGFDNTAFFNCKFSLKSLTACLLKRGPLCQRSLNIKMKANHNENTVY